MRLSFSDKPEARAALDNWWRGLERDRGSRAALRRSRNANDVVLVPAFHRLVTEVSRMAMVHLEPWQKERLALVAALTAHVKRPYFAPSAEAAPVSGDRPEPSFHRDGLPEAMAALNGGKPVVSQNRFRRLLEQSTPEELFLPLLRTLPLLDKPVNLASMADSILHWGDDVRKSWAYAYYRDLPEQSSKKGGN